MDDSEISDEECVARAKRGDRDAYNVLIGRYYKRVVAYCQRLLHNLPDSEEEALDAFLKGWQAIEGFRGDAPFHRWIFTIARNGCCNRMRSKEWQQQQKNLPIDDPQVTKEIGEQNPEYEILARLDVERIWCKVRARIKTQRNLQILILRYKYDLTSQEIGARLSMNPNTVRDRIRRIITPVLEDLRQEGEE